MGKSEGLIFQASPYLPMSDLVFYWSAFFHMTYYMMRKEKRRRPEHDSKKEVTLHAQNENHP